MTKNILIASFILLSWQSIAQKDTIVVTDFSSVLVKTEQNGQLTPISSLEKASQVGFFLINFDNGKIRVCNDKIVAVWADGHLLRLIEQCGYIDPDEIRQVSSTDTVYMTISSESSLENLVCEKVIFEEFKVIRDEVSVPREVRNTFREFVICCVTILSVLLGLFFSGYTSRISYILQKTFTFKISAYEFINTYFFSAASVYLISFYSFAISFSLLYLDMLFEYGLIEEESTLLGYLFLWVRNAFVLFALLIAKWAFIGLTAWLFNFRGLKNYQMFDFINFQTFLFVPAVLFMLIDFIVNTSNESWLGGNFIFVFPITLILFIIWFTLKFVNNSPRKKLMIISYLCATEIVPVIILLGWFFK